MSAWSSQVLLLPTEEDGINRPSSQHAGDLDHGDVELAEKAEPDELGDVGQMDVDVFHLAGVDALAAGRVGLVGQPQLDAVDLRQRAVEFGRRGCAGPDADPELFAGRLGVLDALGERQRHRLG